MSFTKMAPARLAAALACRIRPAALVLATLALTLGGLPLQPAGAQQAGNNVQGATDQLSLEVRQGKLVRLDRPAASVFVADPDIADVQAHSASLVYVFGRRAGVTTLFAVDGDENLLFSSVVTVEHPVTRMRQVIESLGLAASVDVQSIDGGILLSGDVADPATAEDLRELVTRFVGENEVVLNRLTIRAPTQVNLRVRVAEMSRDVTKIFGISWDNALAFGDFALGLSTGRPFAAGNTITGSFENDNLTIDGVIDALEREGLVTVLAEPNLTALSGETASFLAGGEFPVPVGTENNDIQIEFKQFGVSLSFTPTVLSRNRIGLRVRPEVSDLSENGAITLQNIVIPALATRRAETTVELGSGQSFAIGGLISNSTRNSLEKVPGIGDLPILGTLFRSTSFRQRETELVIIVTPYLVEPRAERDLALPTDGFRAPTQLELILDGRLAGSYPRPGPTARSTAVNGLRLAGPAGFVIN